MTQMIIHTPNIQIYLINANYLHFIIMININVMQLLLGLKRASQGYIRVDSIGNKIIKLRQQQHKPYYKPIKFIIIFILTIVVLNFLLAAHTSSKKSQIYWQPIIYNKKNIGLNNQYKINENIRKFYSSFYQYLGFKHAKTLLQVGCTVQCILEQDQELTANIQIEYASQIRRFKTKNQNHNENVKDSAKYQDQTKYDWININICLQTLRNIKLLTGIINQLKDYQNYSRVGLSLSFPKQAIQLESSSKLYKEAIINIRRSLSEIGYIYNQIQTLKVRRFTTSKMDLFLRFAHSSNTESRGTKTSRYDDLKQTSFALFTMVDMKHDLAYLRQWIAYHFTLGINKIFIYENFKEYEQDQKQQNKQQYFSCKFMGSKLIQKQWQYIYDQYYNKIVYVPWYHPKQVPIFGYSNFAQVNMDYPISSVLSYFAHILCKYFFFWYPPVQLSPQQDFIYNFKSDITTTIFLQQNEILYSKLGMNVVNLIQDNVLAGFSKMYVDQQYFLHRDCNARGCYMLENYYYYDSQQIQKKSYKFIFRTDHFIGTYKQENKQNIQLKSGKPTKMSEIHLKIKSYSVTKNSLFQSSIRKEQKSYRSFLNPKIDDSIQTKLELVKRQTNQQCYSQFKLCTKIIQDICPQIY